MKEYPVKIRRPPCPRVGQSIEDAENNRKQRLQDKAESSRPTSRFGMSSKNALENR